MRQLVFLVLAGAIMLGLFVVFSPAQDASGDKLLSQPAADLNQPRPSAEKADADGASSRRQAAPPSIKRFRLEVGEAGLISGPQVIRVRQGEDVEIALVSSIDDELHLHGYDRHLELKAGETAVLALTTNLSGRFEYELHDRHIELGALEVLPD